MCILLSSIDDDEFITLYVGVVHIISLTGCSKLRGKIVFDASFSF